MQNSKTEAATLTWQFYHALWFNCCRSCSCIFFFSSTNWRVHIKDVLRLWIKLKSPDLNLDAIQTEWWCHIYVIRWEWALTLGQVRTAWGKFSICIHTPMHLGTVSSECYLVPLQPSLEVDFLLIQTLCVCNVRAVSEPTGVCFFYSGEDTWEVFGHSAIVLGKGRTGVVSPMLCFGSCPVGELFPRTDSSLALERASWDFSECFWQPRVSSIIREITLTALTCFPDMKINRKFQKTSALEMHPKIPEYVFWA